MGRQLGRTGSGEPTGITRGPCAYVTHNTANTAASKARERSMRVRDAYAAGRMALRHADRSTVRAHGPTHARGMPKASTPLNAWPVCMARAHGPMRT